MQNLVSHPVKRDTGSLSLSSGFMMTDIKRETKHGKRQC